MKPLRASANSLLCAIAAAACACAHDSKAPSPPPSVAPADQATVTLSIGGAEIRPMYRELLAIDLPTITRVAIAQNIDIKQAQERVLAARGRYESSVEAVFPVIAPSIAFQHLEGAGQNANGTLVLTNFSNILPAITVQWILNPGRAVYDIVAAKRRMEASDQQERAVVLETARTAAVQYYQLVRAQARVANARRAERQSDESLRLVDLRFKAGDALSSDQMKARSSLASRREELLLAVNAFYRASLDLTLTLHLDPIVTLVPEPDHLSRITLVREDLAIDALLALAVQYRPDLQEARTLLAAVQADKGGALWGSLGPQLQAAYSYGSIKADAQGQTFGPDRLQKGAGGAGFALGVSTFGQVKTANANVRSAALDVEKTLDHVRAEVVASQQDAITQAAVIPIAGQELESADEALRLAQAGLQAGTVLLLEVLKAESERAAAQQHYADAVARYNQAQVNLLAALGMLTEQTLCVATISAPTAAGPSTETPAH